MFTNTYNTYKHIYRTKYIIKTCVCLQINTTLINIYYVDLAFYISVVYTIYLW